MSRMRLRRSISPAAILARTACGLGLSLALGVSAAGESAIGYRSVRAARDALVARRDVVVSAERGWTLIREPAAPGHTEWAFLAREHPAYPALVRRDVVLRAGTPTLVTRFLCEGARAACETLYARVRAHGQAPGDAPLAVVPE